MLFVTKFVKNFGLSEEEGLEYRTIEIKDEYEKPGLTMNLKETCIQVEKVKTWIFKIRIRYATVITT